MAFADSMLAFVVTVRTILINAAICGSVVLLGVAVLNALKGRQTPVSQMPVWQRWLVIAVFGLSSAFVLFILIGWFDGAI